MRRLLILVFAFAALVAADTKKGTFTGVITCTMCGADHKAMKVTPDDKCVRECVRHHGSRYGLLDGNKVYMLSDQKTPEAFAAQKVKVTGVLYTKTNIIKVEKIEAAAK